MENQQLSSGAMAKMCGINKKTLFYYDDIDLLKPAGVNSNGYRFYTLDQVDQLSKIKALQSVGFSLSEIKQQMSATGLAEGLATLFQQQQKVGQLADELLAVKEALSLKIHELEQYEKQGVYRVFTDVYPEQWLHVDDAPQSAGFIANYILDGYHFGILFYDEADSAALVKYQYAEEETANFKKPQGKYAGIYFESADSEIMVNARKALAMLKKSGYPLAGPAFLKDVASDFINFPSGQLAFLLTVKVEMG